MNQSREVGANMGKEENGWNGLKKSVIHRKNGNGWNIGRLGNLGKLDNSRKWCGGF